MGFESRIFISAEQFTMSRSNHSLDGSAPGGGAHARLDGSLSPPTVGRRATTTHGLRKASTTRRRWSQSSDEDEDSVQITHQSSSQGHAAILLPNHEFTPILMASKDDLSSEGDDENDSIGSHDTSHDDDDIGRIITLLHDKGFETFENLVFAMNALFMVRSVLEKANFESREILRFFRLIIKIFSPNPPKRASSDVPRKQKVKKVPKGSTSRFEIMMKIWLRTGVRDFVCDAQKVIRGIFLSTANPMVASSIITAINAIDQFPDPPMKRMCLFLIALASGISCDSPVVRSPKLLADFFDSVYDAISEGMHEGLFKFVRDTVLPADNFPPEFADDAWRILNYVNHMFAKIPNLPAESSAGKKAVSKKPQDAAEGGKQAAKKSADDNPFEGFDKDIVDDASISTNACSAINPEDLPVFMQHIFHCFYHALGLVEEENANIMGLTTGCSLEFAILSLLHAPMQPIPAIAFTQLSSLLSMISSVGATIFQINHPKSVDFLSKLACLVRLLRPEGDQAEALLKTWFAEDMQQFLSGKNLSSVMHELYVLFREQLLDDKRRVLDDTFTTVFPNVKLSIVQNAASKPPKSNEREKVKFASASGGGAAAANQSIMVQCADVEYRQFQAFKRDQAAFEQWQKEQATAKGKKK